MAEDKVTRQETLIDRFNMARLELKAQYWSVLDFLSRKVARSAPAIIRIIDGAVPPASFKRLCLFAHYDRDGILDDYVVHYLEQLHGLGCEIILVSTSENLRADSIASALPFCRAIILRENVGFDFSSWKVGFDFVGTLSTYNRLVLANDSVYGPVRDLRDVFAKMESRNLDFWGITDSYEFRYHLQSYFLVFSKTTFESRPFQLFWSKLPYHKFKISLVRKCEIGLSERLLKAGFHLGALCEYAHIKKEHPLLVSQAEKVSGVSRPANSSLSLWWLLVENYGCPFLKVMLLRDNPLGDKTVNSWPAVLEGASNYDIDLIRRHVNRTAPTR